MDGNHKAPVTRAFSLPSSPPRVPAATQAGPAFRPRRRSSTEQQPPEAGPSRVPVFPSVSVCPPPQDIQSSQSAQLPPEGAAPRTVEAYPGPLVEYPPPPMTPLPAAGTVSPRDGSEAPHAAPAPSSSVAFAPAGRGETHSLGRVLITPGTPAWLCSGFDFVRSLLPGYAMDHRRRRARRRANGRKPPLTVEEYGHRNLFDAAQFAAIASVRAIKTSSGRGTVSQENRACSYKSRLRHVPCRTAAATGSDVLYVRCEGEDKYCVSLLNLFGRYRRYEGLAPDIRLVAFPRPFQIWYSLKNRARWGKDEARESRLRWRSVDAFFHVCHNIEFFAVPSAARRGLYPGLPADWVEFEVPEYLCVPTNSSMAYVAAHWLPLGRSESAETKRTRALVQVIVLSEWAVLALICFSHAGRERFPVFTKFRDPRLLARHEEPFGECGVLFRLSTGLIELIRAVGFAGILEGTAFDATYVT